jgi:hypothetical protein
MRVGGGDDNDDSDSIASSASSQGSYPGDSLLAPTSVDNRKKRPAVSTGLSTTLQRQLLKDIERSGGITNVSLKGLCNKKTDIYGLPSSSLRKAVQNKASRWKRLTKHQYKLLVLELLGDDGTDRSSTSARKKPAVQTAAVGTPQTNATAKRRLEFESPPAFFLSPGNMNNTNRTAMMYIDRVMKERNYGKYLEITSAHCFYWHFSPFLPPSFS